MEYKEGLVEKNSVNSKKKKPFSSNLNGHLKPCYLDTAVKIKGKFLATILFVPTS